MKTKILTLSFLLLLIMYSCKKNDSVAAIDYPYSSNYGTNILNDSVLTIVAQKISDESVHYSMAANLSVKTNLKVILKGGTWVFHVMPQAPINWTITQYTNKEQSFTSTESGKSCDLSIKFLNHDTITVEYYENKSITPTKIKKFFVQ
jgi:hypothetical protein